MAKKISIALTSRNSLIFKLPQLSDLKDLNVVLQNVSNFINDYLLIISSALLFLLPSITIMGRPSLMVILYSVTVLVLLNRILRKFFFKGEHFPTVPLDLQLLTLTTFISFSFFYNTAIVQVNSNIWGGKALQEISGVSLIAYWFYYYLLYTSITNKVLLKRLILSFWFAPAIALLGVLIFNLQLNYSAYILIMLLHPMWLYLTLTSKNHNKLHLLNLTISSLLIISGAPQWAGFTIAISYLLLLIYLIISKSKSLPSMFKDLDLQIKPFDLALYIRKNSYVFMLLSTLIFTFLGFYFIYSNIDEQDFINLEKGYSQLTNLQGLQILLGQGLKAISTPKAAQFIFSYGLATGLMLIYIAIEVSRKIRTMLKSSKNENTNLLIRSLILGILPITLFLFLSPTDTELFPLLSITIVSVIFLLKRIQIDREIIAANNELSTDNELKANQSYFLRIMKIIILIICLLGFIYLLSYLNYINIFINT